MKSESKNNSLFRPLKKASTVAFVAFALFASAAHADLGEKVENSKEKAQAIIDVLDQDSSQPPHEYRGEKKKGLITLVFNDGAGTSCAADVTRLVQKSQKDRKHLVQSADCFFNDKASLAK
jgi:hypothetical protein